jgi:hypothetical protein
MSAVFPGRYSAQTDEPFVVFLIGMRINRLRAIHKWLPVANAMPPMIQELMQHPEKGMMHSQFFISWRTVLSVQYWRSFEQLEAFARNPNDPHLPAWQRFNKAVGGNGIVGIYHETYLVQAGQYEAIYGNMPLFGLAAATQHTQVAKKRETARRRLGGENEPAVPFPQA